MFIEFLAITLTFVVIVTLYYQNAYKYWIKKRVPSIPPQFPLGNTNVILPKGFTLGKIVKQFYDHLKLQGHKFGGVYLVTEPNLVIVDPEIIKDILSKKFQHFVDRGFYYNQKHDVISANLFTVDGPQWRNLRTKLTPTFTSSKMKMMFQIVIECCDYMIDSINKSLDKDLDFKEFVGRYATDVVGSCGFGIECNSFKHPDAEFRKMGLRSFHFDFVRSLRAFFIANVPKLALRLGLTSNNKDICNFFTKLVEDTIKSRQENGIKRNDFFQILMNLKDSETISFDEMVAQVFLFFTAGFETSSTAMTMCLYELAENPEIQNKLRLEICQVLEKYGGQFTYESLTEMKYLEQVFEETLRKYPPGLTLNRRCTEDYTIPDTDIIITKGTPILISVLGLHRDPEYYPKPEIFDPERFNENNKKKRHPFVYLPFGDGPRNCIGMRFGSMQSKIGIASIIKNFKVRISPSTKPIEIDPCRFIFTTVHKIYFRAEKV